MTATATAFYVVRDEPGPDFDYADAPVAAGPFATSAEAHEWLGDDDRFITVKR